MTTAKMNVASIALAIPLAGPIFVVLSFAVDWSATSAMTPNALGMLALMVPVLMFAAAFGSIIALIPCVVGAAVMTALGRGNVAFRLPVMWALAGGGVTAVTALLIAGGDGAPALIATGTICALICRHGVRWDDDSAIVPPRQPAICVQHDT